MLCKTSDQTCGRKRHPWNTANWICPDRSSIVCWLLSCCQVAILSLVLSLVGLVFCNILLGMSGKSITKYFSNMFSLSKKMFNTVQSHLEATKISTKTEQKRVNGKVFNQYCQLLETTSVQRPHYEWDDNSAPGNRAATRLVVEFAQIHVHLFASLFQVTHKTNHGQWE